MGQIARRVAALVVIASLELASAAYAKPASTQPDSLALVKVGSKKIVVESKVRTESLQIGLPYGVFNWDERGCLYFQRLYDPGDGFPIPSAWLNPQNLVLPARTKISKDGRHLVKGKTRVPIGQPIKGLALGVEEWWEKPPTAGPYSKTKFPKACAPNPNAWLSLISIPG